MSLARVVRPARRRGPIVVVVAALAAVLALSVVAQRPALVPVLATVSVGSWAGPVTIGMDELAGRAYVATHPGGPGGGGVVRILDTATGALVGTATVPGQNGGGVAMAVDAQRGRAYVANAGSTSCSSTRGGAQTCATTGAAVVTLDARTGRPRRTLSIDVGRALAVDGRTGLLYALSSGGATTLLRAIDPGTGRTVRTIALSGGGPGFGFATLTLDGHGRHLVVARSSFGPSGGPRWSADVVDVAQGRLVRHIPLSGAGFVDLYHPPLIDEARGRAYVGLGSYGYGVGGVAVIDTRRATLLRATATGAGFGDIAEDTRTGRIFTTALGGVRQRFLRRTAI